MELTNNNSPFHEGDIVYVFYRNPHTQDVANIQEAVIIKNPEDHDELSLFLYETYYPLTNETAVYMNEADAEQAYDEYFGDYNKGRME
jgi:transcriptional regulator of the spore photoproduct lyase operon